MPGKRTIPLDRGFNILLTDLGLSAVEILKSIGLPEEWVHGEDVYISLEEYYKMWGAIVEAAQLDTLPIGLAEATTSETLDTPIFAALYCKNYKMAIKKIQEYRNLVAPIIIETEETDSSFTISFDWPQIGTYITPALFLSVLTYFTQLARLATRSRIEPVAVEYRSGIVSSDAYLEFFGVRPSQGERYSLSFSLEDVEKPFLTANETSWNFYEPEFKNKLREFEASRTIADRVCDVLYECIPTGECSLNSIAKKLNMNARTLQRQLAQENLTFNDLLASIREKLARYYLNNTKLTNAEISSLLGFKEPNSFVRAYKTWTGHSPGMAKHQSKSLEYSVAEEQ